MARLIRPEGLGKDGGYKAPRERAAQKPESIRAEAARRGVSVWKVRIERGRSRGLSLSQARGRPKAGEVSARELRGLQQQVWRQRQAMFANEPRYIAQIDWTENIARQTDPEMLRLMAGYDEREMRSMASLDLEDNPAHYHHAGEAAA